MVRKKLNPEPPITFKERFTELLTLITGLTPPEGLVDDWLGPNELTGLGGDLQDWVGEWSECPWWLQNIGVLDMAHAGASAPCEGEHHRIDYRQPGELISQHINNKGEN